jgi:hypothetical protein
MPAQAEPFAKHRPDVPQCVGDARYRGSKTGEEHYAVIHIVPRVSPLNCRSRIRYAVPSVCFGAMIRIACNAHATALCATKAMPVPCGRCSSNNAKLHRPCARANEFVAQREFKGSCAPELCGVAPVIPKPRRPA